MKTLTLLEKFEKWNKGEHTYGPAEYALLKIKKGQKINKSFLDLLGECTICPVGNSSCLEYFEIVIHGIHPNEPLKIKKIRICPLGCTSKNCILNK
jgi:hypothetical protein